MSLTVLLGMAVAARAQSLRQWGGISPRFPTVRKKVGASAGLLPTQTGLSDAQIGCILHRDCCQQ